MNTDEKSEDTGGSKFREAIDQVQKLVPNAARGHSDAMLAAQRLAQPFAQLRANQLRMEVARARTREAAAAFAARADAADRQIASIDGEIARLRIVQPETCADSVTVYGYVRDGGEPLAGAVVALFEGEETRAQIETDAEGAFTLSVCSDVPLGVQVMKGRKLVHRDVAELHAPSAVAAYRIIDIREGQTPAPAQDPPKGECGPSEQPGAASAETGAQFGDLISVLGKSDVAHELEWSDVATTKKWLAARKITDVETAREAASLAGADAAKRLKLEAQPAERFQRALAASLETLGKS